VAVPDPFLWDVVRALRGKKKKPEARQLYMSLVLGSSVTVALPLTVLEGLRRVPVLGEQLGYMIPH
jgi:hypothetical protein